MENLPCQENKEKITLHSEKHNETSKAITRIETSLQFMQKSIDSLAQSIQKDNKFIIDPYTKSHSPLSITIAGRNMIERLEVDKMFERNWERINSFIEDNASSKNPYDIQEFLIQQAVVYPEKFLQSDEIDKIKIDAYNTGVNIVPYMKVIAVLARDKYFSEHNILVEEVDKHNPSNKKPE
ncbi:hypothetical protein [Parabacteroides chongii]|uniref:hypothetical protein n=3 Tax=Parabacteroides chongii TaxID=2685834 RepID=UPI00240FCB44|nr:hypothetical protein [Parabacteroides chongii]WFE87231.1 hypothetical protein P3L47_23545 [Parabacteroides chongii]